MNEQKVSKELVEDFLEEVTRKLPLWLKTDSKDLKETREELEAHIWDKATELAKGAEPEVYHVQQAIAQMGNPKKIAQEYRRRGTPKYFITEELWPVYLKSLIIIGAIIFFVNMLTMAFAIGRKNIGTIIGETFSGIFEGFLIGFVVITIIFVQLSWHGYLPQDFEQWKFLVTEKKEKKEMKPSPKYEAEVVEPRTKNYGMNYLGDGISNLIIGFLLVFLPFNNIIDFINIEQSTWLRLLGGIALLTGIFRFTQVFIGNNLRLQQLFKALYLIPASLNIPLFWQLKAEVNPAILYNPLIEAFPDANITLYINIGVWFVIAGTIIAMIVEVVQIILLETRGFPKKGK